MSNQVIAGEADVVSVKVHATAEGEYRFDVTVLHTDTGWQHYADRWEVLSLEGELLGARILYHPHVDEQPFTRSLSGVKIAPSIQQVILRAHDSVHELGGKTVLVELPR